LYRFAPEDTYLLKFAANLSFLYPELPFLDRFAAAAADGFKAVEYAVPYVAAPEELAARLKANGLVQALFNLPAGDWDGGERGIACHPDRVEEFRTGVEVALRYAEALDCKKINCLAAGVLLVIEPINQRDMPGFWLSTSAHAERLLEMVGSDNLKIQYDIYHMQIMQGDLMPTYARLKDKIGHIQIADTPGRHEPGTGEINYGFVFAELDRLGYDGWIGAEYKPLTTTSAGLGWMAPFR
jgi:hydroxypyruvate isomerase